MSEIKIGDRNFSVEIMRKKTRSLKLRLVSSTQIIISAPPRVSLNQINEFIFTNTPWILSKVSKIKDRRHIGNVSPVEILGKPYELIVRQTLRDSLVVALDTQTIHLNCSDLTPSHLNSVFDKKMRPFAFSLIKSEVTKLASKYNLKLSKLSVKNQSSRFGSCSSTGNLNFNWQIIFFPYPLFQHIILHELAHLTHHNHSVSFWSLLKEYDPEWEKHHQWLKKEANGYLF